MSIFPKRSVPGGTVTIHWNFNTAHLKDVHIFPWVRIGVRDPKGKETMLFEKHVLGLPDPVGPKKRYVKKLKYLNKNLPLMIVADYLGGRQKTERLVEILQNIQSGRHYYFTYHVPEDAPAGKYTLISEVHSGGEVRYSKTAADDYFFIEKITLERIVEDASEAIVFNHSEERTPVKVIGCHPLPEGKMHTDVEVFEIPPLQETSIKMSAPVSYLAYNEERQIIPLQYGSSGYLLRNQCIPQAAKADGSIYLFKKDVEEAYALEEAHKLLWEKANGLINTASLSDNEKPLLDEMAAEGLIHKVSFD
ncbi:hypothetical protein C900_05086 [Fulvivirga imtechensis AK7]|uniref:Uncharacterized protein n=1 Tax=Fulvivirga imtechensis AK7 TaxID=1237149 RepID=L8JKF0_9BACT|nr:hypothetical protein [Fulvivirga imtechensis]ELR69396.1 hypothetical protein C900_05086 [Fulvivirga imtechensis AK7]